MTINIKINNCATLAMQTHFYFWIHFPFLETDIFHVTQRLHITIIWLLATYFEIEKFMINGAISQM